MNRVNSVMRFAVDLTTQSKCDQIGVAAVIANKDLTQIYSIGLNGGPKGGINCLCSLGGKETCIHAETQAIAKCTSTDTDKVMFTTLSPCVTCASLIINNGFSKVYYSESWKDDPGVKLLRAAGIQVAQV